MFDPETAKLLRSAPELPGLNPEELPARLTRHYARLASIRLMGSTEIYTQKEDTWSLERIADTYELIVSLQPTGSSRSAAAFVAATAQQIISRQQIATIPVEELPHNIDRDRLDPSLASVILFLASEQYADANEAASKIRAGRRGESYESTIISEHLIDLARGQLTEILARAKRWRRPVTNGDIGERAMAALLEALATGIELLAAEILHVPAPKGIGVRFDSPEDAFKQVISLASAEQSQVKAHVEDMIITYPGPYHLASLLLSLLEVVTHSSLLNTSCPTGSNPEIWEKWLRFRAKRFPYVWPNHRQAIENGFHEKGISSVVILPTGAGKTTVSSLKIAGVLARGKKVAFLAPTHALVEQLTEDLQEMFPQDLFGSKVSSDYDKLMQKEASFQDIEVMTPERCLAMLSFAPEAFHDVGLLVFDECHLLSSSPRKVRRALDAMLCVLGFSQVSPEADFLFLSAMLKNGDELAQWLEQLTGRASIQVDLLWKPSRQARGVIIYDSKELEVARKLALQVQKAEDERQRKRAKGLRVASESELAVIPHAIWGLQHNWLSIKESTAEIIMTQLLERHVTLSGSLGGSGVRLKPNANRVATEIACAAATNSIKTIVFVNTKRDAISVAEDVSSILSYKTKPTSSELELWNALEVELGDLRHSLLSGPTTAVPHNSAMLKIERDIAERMFKREDGAHVIVATPTLAQGLNLPAHLAILAGDKRASSDSVGREDLEAHEILNAAARAGRAGHLANGLVLLIPEPIISFTEGEELDSEVVKKLQAILPEDDRCVAVEDPLEIILDRLVQGRNADPDVGYMVNRMAVIQSEENATSMFNLSKSLGAFAANRRNDTETFDAKVEALKETIAKNQIDGLDQKIAVLSSRSGLPAQVLIDLRSRIEASIGSLPTSVEKWLEWIIQWFDEDEVARNELLGDIKKSILTACGKKKTSDLASEDLALLLAGLISWVNGETLRDIEAVLGGEPNSDSPTKRSCPRAREIAGTIVSRGISFALGLVAHIIKDVSSYDQQSDLEKQLVESLSTLVRRGFNSVNLLNYASSEKKIFGRVQAHEAWKRRLNQQGT